MTIKAEDPVLAPPSDKPVIAPSLSETQISSGPALTSTPTKATPAPRRAAAANSAPDFVAELLGGGTMKSRADFWCDLCQKSISNCSAAQHFAVVHFEEKLKEILPTSAPFFCPFCRYEAKTFLKLSTHYLAKHNSIEEWMKEALMKTEREVMEREANRIANDGSVAEQPEVKEDPAASAAAEPEVSPKVVTKKEYDQVLKRCYSSSEEVSTVSNGNSLIIIFRDFNHFFVHP